MATSVGNLRRVRKLGPRKLAPGDQVELVDHLGELRTRLMISFIALGVAFAATFAYHHLLINLLNRPLDHAHIKPVTLGVAEPFMTSIKVSLFAAFGVALPVITWQVWGFFAPAFSRGSKASLAGFFSVATVLFVGGLAFGYFIALPSAVKFLTGYDSTLYEVQVRAQDYYTFSAMAIIACAIVFELPVMLLALVRFGVLPIEKLRGNRRIGYVCVAVIGVALPGVDPVTTFIEMIPLWILYEATVWVAIVLDKRWSRQKAIADAAE